jgi:site-specific DNA recombinase
MRKSWIRACANIAVAAESISDDKISKSFEEAEIERLEKEIEKARAGRKRLFKMFQEEPDLEEEIRQEIRELKEREDELIGQIQELKDHKMN